MFRIWPPGGYIREHLSFVANLGGYIREGAIYDGGGLYTRVYSMSHVKYEQNNSIHSKLIDQSSIVTPNNAIEPCRSVSA